MEFDKKLNALTNERTSSFKAIIARLYFSYADKTPIQVIKPEQNFLRPGDLSPLKIALFLAQPRDLLSALALKAPKMQK